MPLQDILVDWCYRLRGVNVTLIASFLFAAANFIVFYICHVGAFEVYFFRSGALVILFVPILYCKGHPVYIPRTWIIWIAGIFLATMPLLYVATQNMNYGDLNAIFFSNSILVVLLGWIFLGERISWKTFVIIILMLVGTIMVVQPESIFGEIASQGRLNQTYCDAKSNNADGDTLYILTVGNKVYTFPKTDNTRLKRKCNRTAQRQDIFENVEDFHIREEIVNDTNWTCEETRDSHVTGVLIKLSWLGACACMFAVGLSQAVTWTLIRACKEMDFVYVSFHQLLSACVVTVIVTSALGQWQFPALVNEWLLIAALSLGSAGAYAGSNYGLSLEKSATVSIVKNSEIVLSYILQVAFQGVIPNWISVLGALLVIFCGLTFGFLRSREEVSDYEDVDDVADEKQPIK